MDDGTVTDDAVLAFSDNLMAVGVIEIALEAFRAHRRVATGPGDDQFGAR